jgi:hypothetical protein
MENDENNRLLKDIFENVCLQNDSIANVLSVIETIEDDDVKKDAIVEVVNAQQMTKRYIAELLIKYIHN